jgi:RimJ/RimL family protein N-acetyltransferase
MIRGKLCGLRAVEREDLPLLRDWRNMPEFRRNFREHRELNMQNQENWFGILASSQRDFMFVIEDLQSREAIGACGLLYTNWIIRAADVSFYIGKDAQYIDKSGMAADAAAVLLDYGFKELNLNKLWMELYEFDELKLEFFKDEMGFTIDGKLRSNCFTDGRYWDSYILSLLTSDRRSTSLENRE